MPDQAVFQEHNPEFRKIVLVGLGGAGQQILVCLKRLLLDTYKVIPPSIKFFSMDTDATRVQLSSRVIDKEIGLGPEEYLHLKVDDPIGFLTGNKDVNKWFIGPAPLGAIRNGAGAIRQNGRLAFFYHIREIRQRLNKIMTELNDINLPQQMENARDLLGAETNFTLSPHEPEVFVCGSLAGGTGSGTFIDTGILLRHLAGKMLIHGFFILNWVYRNKAFAHRVRGNVYAALSELDYLQSIMYGDPSYVPYQQRYHDEMVTVKSPPYDLFNLIDGQNEHGENIDSVDELCETIAQAIFLSISSMSYKINSVIDNLLAHVNVQSPRTWDGRYARYSSVGVSSIYYPAPEIFEEICCQQAIKYCDSAIQEVSGATGTGSPEGEVEANVSRFFNNNSISLASIQPRVFANFGAVSFEEADLNPAAIEDLQESKSIAESDLNNQLKSLYDANGQPLLEGLKTVLKNEIASIRNNPSLSSAYFMQWLDSAKDKVNAIKDDISEKLSQAEEQVLNLSKNADAIFQEVVNSRYIPIVGGPRKYAIRRWAKAVLSLLDFQKTAKILDYLKRVLNGILEILENSRPGSIPASAEICAALEEARRTLGNLHNKALKNIQSLRVKPSIILEGEGRIVVYDKHHEQQLGMQDQQMSYNEFKKENHILRGEDYLLQPWELLGLFLGYCRKKFIHLKDMTIEKAINTNGNINGDVNQYLRQQVDHLFRKASPLWKFRKDQLRGLRQTHYDRIINIGVENHEKGADLLEDAVMAARPKYHIVADHAYSTTKEKYHIWMLNYSAVLPAYLLEDLQRSRQIYEEEISPSYHIDKDFEMNIPDLFPVDDIANMSLRVLGMAIIEGIDVIKDIKLIKGHKFVCDAEPVIKLNADEPKVWLLFQEMLQDIIESSNMKEQNNLLDILIVLLKEKVKSILANGFNPMRQLILNHQGRYERKLATRSFSRLLSARTTFREIKELNNFMNPKVYNWDIDRYINGK